MNSLCHEVELLNYDIVLLQETRVSRRKQQAQAFERQFGVEIDTGRSGPVDRRVLPFLLRLTFLVLSSVLFFDSDGRILSLSFVFNSSKLNVVNIYAPNLVSDRKTLFERLHNYFLFQGDYVIAGDFNCVDRINFSLIIFRLRIKPDSALLDADTYTKKCQLTSSCNT